MRKYLLLATVLLLAGCAGSTLTKAQQAASAAEQAFTLADTAWLAYLRAPDCATTKQKFCSQVDIIAKGMPKEQTAYDNVETFYATAYMDPTACDQVSATMKATCLQYAAGGLGTTTLDQIQSAAALALAGLQSVIATLPQKGT